MIVTFGSIKGGPGKTTSLINTAVALAQQGHDIMCVDSDKQMSLTKWFSYRDSGIELHNCSLQGNIIRSLKKLQSRYEIVLVDVAGGDTEELRTAMQVSDALVCPIEPSQLDLDTLPDFLKLIDYAKSFNESLEERFFLNRCTPLRTMDNALEVAEVLGQMDEINLLDTWVYINKQFVNAFPEGKSVLELQTAQKASYNFTELFNELMEDLFSEISNR